MWTLFDLPLLIFDWLQLASCASIAGKVQYFLPNRENFHVVESERSERRALTLSSEHRRALLSRLRGELHQIPVNFNIYSTYIYICIFYQCLFYTWVINQWLLDKNQKWRVGRNEWTVSECLLCFNNEIEQATYLIDEMQQLNVIITMLHSC